jgi:hypothetical protein
MAYLPCPCLLPLATAFPVRAGGFLRQAISTVSPPFPSARSSRQTTFAVPVPQVEGPLPVGRLS